MLNLLKLLILLFLISCANPIKESFLPRFCGLKKCEYEREINPVVEYKYVVDPNEGVVAALSVKGCSVGSSLYYSSKVPSEEKVLEQLNYLGAKYALVEVIDTDILYAHHKSQFIPLRKSKPYRTIAIHFFVSEKNKECYKLEVK